MVKRIAMFNHKGGVSKTATTFNIGWMLASKGHRVLMVDASPQYNLTELILGKHSYEEFERFYQDNPNRNLRAGLKPAFESSLRLIEAVDCIEVDGMEGLYLLPGHIQLSEYEVMLSIAQQLWSTSNAVYTLRSLPGSISYLLNKTAKKLQADYMLVDLNPNSSAINQNLLMTSNYFIMPATADYFSVLAVKCLLNVLPRWHYWSQRSQSRGSLKSATYPFPTGMPKFLGTVIQNYPARQGAQRWIDEINRLVVEAFIPALSEIDMALSPHEYNRITGFTDTYCLAQIPDNGCTYQFSLMDTVLTPDQKKSIPKFDTIFSSLTDQILTLTT